MWLILFIFCSEEPWHLQDTRIFTPLTPRQVSTTEDLSFFLLDKTESQILKYDRQGAKIQNFGGNGQGPGELAQPFCLDYVHGLLYVTERHRVSVFDKDCNFLYRLTRPSDWLVIHKLDQGWLGFSGLSFTQKVNEAPLELVWLDERLSSRRVIYSWESESQRTGKKFSYHFKPDMKFNPAEDVNAIVINPDRNMIYVKPNGLNQIFIFGHTDLQLLRTLKIDAPPIRFNARWADAVRQIIIENNPSGAEQLEPDYPEYFPIIMGMDLSKNNKLVVWKWSSNPWLPAASSERFQDPPMVFDQLGEPSEMSPVERFSDRIIAIKDQVAYLLFKNSKEEYTLSRCSVEDLDNFNKKYPLIH